MKFLLLTIMGLVLLLAIEPFVFGQLAPLESEDWRRGTLVDSDGKLLTVSLPSESDSQGQHREKETFGQTPC